MSTVPIIENMQVLAEQALAHLFKLQCKSNQNYFIHKFTKITFIITKHSKFARDDSNNCEIKFLTLCRDIKTNIPIDGVCIFPEEYINDVQNLLLSKYSMTGSLVDKSNNREFKYLTNDLIKIINKVIGIGQLCMTSRPCCHLLKFEDENNRQYTVEYAQSTDINKILINTGQKGNFKVHF